jgi:phosphoribosylanthranilate isomerase
MNRVRIKICGMTTPDDVRLCGDAGADAVGVNFFPGSPRFVDPRQAAPLLRAVPPWVDAVGVFVEQRLRQVYALAYQLGVRSVQWHGTQFDTEDSFPFRLVLAVRVRDRQSLDQVTAALGRCRSAGWSPAALLVDAYVEGQHGGTGRVAPWQLLADFRPGVPVILAGGLTPENVAEAIRAVRPYGVDVASGVESAPGRKDPEKVRRFIENVRSAGPG